MHAVLCAGSWFAEMVVGGASVYAQMLVPRRDGCALIRMQAKIDIGLEIMLYFDICRMHE